DMACYPWIVPYERQGQKLEDFPHLKRWFEEIKGRPGTVRAYARGKEVNPQFAAPMNEDARKVLFGQTAEVIKN
ncbi:MAG: thiol:disulfide oxidoreductase, partial [Rhodomicrobium sp.]